MPQLNEIHARNADRGTETPCPLIPRWVRGTGEGVGEDVFTKDLGTYAVIGVVEDSEGAREVMGVSFWEARDGQAVPAEGLDVEPNDAEYFPSVSAAQRAVELLARLY